MNQKKSGGIVVCGIVEIICGFSLLWSALKFKLNLPSAINYFGYIMGTLYIILGSLLFTRKNIMRIINLYTCIALFSLSLICIILSIIAIKSSNGWSLLIAGPAFLFGLLNAIFIANLTRPQAKEQFRLEGETGRKEVKCKHCDSTEVRITFLGGSGKFVGVLFIIIGVIIIMGSGKVLFSLIWILFGLVPIASPKYFCEACGKKFN